MKELIFMRHGKSSWEYPVEDRDRPLGVRGIHDAKKVARKYDVKAFPEAIYSSPANRALHTCTLFVKTLNLDFKDLKIIPELYDFEGERVMYFIKHLNQDLNRVMLFGHNHAFTALVNALSGNEIGHVPTAGLVHLEFEAMDWKHLAMGNVKQLLFPKNID
ncbi:MAG: hypothetical protein RLZZ241_1363 [Bacteroidota bacterium]|jgi:phosphohistidine phosphatase